MTAVAGFASGAYITKRSTTAATDNLRLQLSANRADQLRERQHALYDEIITYSIHRELTRDVEVGMVGIDNDPRTTATEGYEPPVWLPFRGRVELLASHPVLKAFEAAHVASGRAYGLRAEMAQHRGAAGQAAGESAGAANDEARTAEKALRAVLRQEVQDELPGADRGGAGHRSLRSRRLVARPG